MGSSLNGELSTSKIVGVGYSGHEEVLNNPVYDYLKGIGCIPVGRYTLDGPYTDPEKGPVVFKLIPAPSNNMMGRSGFMLHGDTTPAVHDASDGCIASPLWTRSIFKNEDILDVI